MRRHYVIEPCPNCGLNRVWSARNEVWECIDCNWPVNLKKKRIRELEQARQRYYGIRDPKTNEMKWTGK